MLTNQVPLTRARAAERWLPVAGIALVAVGVGLFATGLGHLVPPCPLRALTGVLCPGCGSGRVARALLAGDVALAWRANPLAMLALPPTLYALTRDALEGWGVARLPWPRTPTWSGWVVLGMVLAFWVLRNVPVWPLSLLAPR